MRKAQLFSQDIIFAIVLVLFAFSVWLILRERVLSMISTSEDKRQIDEAAANAMGQLLESGGIPTNWNALYPINETSIGSIGLVSDRNVLDSGKVSRFIRLAGGHSTSSLAGLWHFDEGSGTAVSDASGNGNNGSDSSASWVSGRFGSGLWFSFGVVHQVVVNDSDSLDMSSNFTVELWFNQPVAGPYEWLLNKGDGQNQQYTNYELYLSTPPYLYASIGNNTVYQSIGSTSIIQANTWYHVAFTADGTTLKLYINGVLENSTSQTITPAPNSGSLIIGSRASHGLLNRFNGTIDEVAIYSRAKSADEIAADYTDEIATESDYISVKRLLGLDRESYRFNLTISSLAGNILYSLNYTPSTTAYNASYAMVNTTASIDRFALLNNSLVKVTMGVWIE
jgi:hypothetical protein